MRIAAKQARITLCSMEDVAEEGGVLRLARKGIYQAWANIAAQKPQLLARSGYLENSGRDASGHIITCAYRPDVLITDAAWIYHARRKSAPEWFRIMGALQKGADFVFYARLVEQSDAAQTPANAGLTDARPRFAPMPGAAEIEI